MSESVVINNTTYNGVDTLALARSDGTVATFYPDAVRYNAQTLTDEQKAQARANIGIATTEEIVQQVIAALGTPVFGTVDEENNIILTGELTNGVYTLKYENADGTTTDIGSLTVGEEESVVNLANHSDAMWETNKRINSSGSTVDVTDTQRGEKTTVITNLIDITGVSTLHVKGLDIMSNLPSGNNYSRVYFYNASGNYVFYQQPSTSAVAENYSTADYDSSVTLIDVSGAIASSGKSGITKFRLGGILTGTAEDVIITADENIV